MASLVKPATRSMWDACRDMFVIANRDRDADLWHLAYRLWVQASVSRAPGTPWMWVDLKPVWLP
jgi:hypothetical protein